ncbi:MAG: SseB family protein [Nocardioides sp.]
MAGPQQRFEGSRIPDPGFAGDDGTADPALEAALAAYRSGTADRAGVLAALGSARLLVPVVALAGSVEYDDEGLAHDKTSDMAAVLLTRPDGRRALLAFASTASLAAWDPEARPVPVAAATAAQAAIQEQADALLLDVAGPVRYAVEGKDLHGVAAGWRLARVANRSAWIRPASE